MFTPSNPPISIKHRNHPQNQVNLQPLTKSHSPSQSQSRYQSASSIPSTSSQSHSHHSQPISNSQSNSQLSLQTQSQSQSQSQPHQNIDLDRFRLSPHDSDEELEPLPLAPSDLPTAQPKKRGRRPKEYPSTSVITDFKKKKEKIRDSVEGEEEKEKRVRAGRACSESLLPFPSLPFRPDDLKKVNCRKLKMKCEGADDPPCRRCDQNGRVCEFERRVDYVMK
jgi:hypothetical protein